MIRQGKTPVPPPNYQCHDCNDAVLNPSPILNSVGGWNRSVGSDLVGQEVDPSQDPYGVYPSCRLAPPANVAVTGSPTLLSTLRDAVLDAFQPGSHRPAPRRPGPCR